MTPDNNRPEPFDLEALFPDHDPDADTQLVTVQEAFSNTYDILEEHRDELFRLHSEAEQLRAQLGVMLTLYRSIRRDVALLVGLRGKL